MYFLKHILLSTIQHIFSHPFWFGILDSFSLLATSHFPGFSAKLATPFSLSYPQPTKPFPFGNPVIPSQMVPRFVITPKKKKNTLGQKTQLCSWFLCKFYFSLLILSKLQLSPKNVKFRFPFFIRIVFPSLIPYVFK